MAKSRFQLVGSLLRPADLREYKIAIEHRDDITYTFYDTVARRFRDGQTQILCQL